MNKMLVNWGAKLGHAFGGQRGRFLRVAILFLCALGILVGLYRARGARIEKEQMQKNRPLKQSGTNSLAPSPTVRWVIVVNPESDQGGGGKSLSGTSTTTTMREGTVRKGDQFVCSVARVAKVSGWKTIIIGDKLECCRMPDCYSIHPSQFLRMSYRTATALKSLIEQSPNKNTRVYKEVMRNLAYIWVMHRGARQIFDAYVDEYIAAGVSIPKFEEELSRQFHALALDESLALVEDKSRSRATGSVFRNPYGHFGRPDVLLVPANNNNAIINNGSPLPPSPPHNLHLAHNRHHPYPPSSSSSSPAVKSNASSGGAGRMLTDFPTFRICEVRPPSIEKFLEIDDGYWDLRAPALVLPGDTMPPLCTRNTMFSPDVFWALPILPDYASDNAEVQDIDMAQNSSRIPPWYIRGLWSQSLLGDLGGSIRLSLSHVPTLQLNQDYFTGGDYESGSSSNSSGKPSSSKLLKRWHCKSRSTFRCLLLISKELSKSVYLRKNDLSLIESWIIDLKSIHYTEPPMLPRRRSLINPCLGADGLHGVSFFPALEPTRESEYSVERRNETLKELQANAEKLRLSGRDRRETRWDLSADLTPPSEGSTHFTADWTSYTAEPSTRRGSGGGGGSMYYHGLSASSSGAEDHHSPGRYAHFRESFKELDDSPSEFVRTLVTHSKRKAALLAERQAAASAEVTEPHNNFRNAKHLMGQFKNSPQDEGEFPILKTMLDNMCPGFGPLIPFAPHKTYDDLLLIIVFSNQHYDLIPTLEVLYRSVFPNMLYCGHPHVSVDLFLRKYQSSEHRSFSFLPTYTRATYECVLGAMEMNYEVKGYLVITDETLMKSWNIDKLDKSKIWVSSSSTSTAIHDSSRHVPVSKNTWQNLDSRGQKLPRLLEGIVNSWKLFSYILVGHDSWLMDNNNNHQTPLKNGQTSGTTHKKNKRSVMEESQDQDPQETLMALETSFVPNLDSSSYSLFQQDVTSGTGGGGSVATNGSESHKQDNHEKPDGDKERGQEKEKLSTSSSSGGVWDLSPSYWDGSGREEENPVQIEVLPSSSPEPNDNSTAIMNNSTMSMMDEEMNGEGDVEVGEEEGEATSKGVYDLLSEDISTSAVSPTLPPPQVEGEEETKDNSLDADIVITPLPLDPLAMDGMNSTESDGITDGGEGSTELLTTSTTPCTNSSVDVPLYHVEHVEPPTPPTWHKPEDDMTSTTSSTTTEEALMKETHNTTANALDALSSSERNNSTVDDTNESQLNTSQSESQLTPSSSSATNSSTQENQAESSGPLSTRIPDVVNVTSPPRLISSTSSSPVVDGAAENVELTREMNHLLDNVQDVYRNMLHVVSEYKEFNDSVKSSSIFNSEGTEPKSLLDTRSHRISPREFRHVRCTMADDGHQSDLCSTLRSFVATLGQNVGEEMVLDYDTIPMYYLPSWATKSFYSVANVLLHFGVTDELALPLLFRGLAAENEWIKLNRSPALKITSNDADDENDQQHQPSSPSVTTLTSMEDDKDSHLPHYFHPFNLHKVFIDADKRKLFCSNYLLRVFQM